jgi:hypothetical protein
MRLSNIICRSLLIWAATCIMASCFHGISENIDLNPVDVTILSLLFSLPALFFLIPNFYLLNSVIGKNNRIIYAIISILMLCLVVVVVFLIFTDGYSFEKGMLFRLLLPYILSAEISFFLFAGRFILVKN